MEREESSQPQTKDENSSAPSLGNISRAKKYMFLRAGQSTFALSLAHVREVLGLTSIATMPNMPSYFAGLINLRGKIISAVFLERSLAGRTEAKSNSHSKRPCIVIVETRIGLFGAIVDDIVDVQSIPSEQIEASADSLKNNPFFEGLIKRPDTDLAPILNINKALRIDELIQAPALKAG